MMLERQWANMVMSDTEDVLKFTNRYHDATKHLIASSINLEPEKIVSNYCIAMKNRSLECCRRFDVQNNITFDEMKKLPLGIESTKKESKARVDETRNSVSIKNKNNPKKLFVSAVLVQIIQP